MPSRNSVKNYLSDSYYHVYNRGANKQPIFMDESDYAVFLGLLKRYLSPITSKDIYSRDMPNYSNQIELLAFCLMSNHFHLLIYQKDNTKSMPGLVKSLLTSYVMYFNKKYQRSGTLFQGPYKASMIDSDAYLHHISRYIHLNPDDYEEYEWSSYRYYAKDYCPDWLKMDRILGMFKHSGEYLDFMRDYKEYELSLVSMKHQLAN